MLETNKFSVINIRRYLNSDNPKLGESRLHKRISSGSIIFRPCTPRRISKERDTDTRGSLLLC